MNSTTPKIVLASSSKYRQQQLSQLGLRFSTIAPKVDETPQNGETPQALAERLAVQKAERVLGMINPQNGADNTIVIGSDQCAELNGQIYGKPGNHAKAAQQLAQSAGDTVFFYTSVCVLTNTRQLCRTVITKAHFKPLSTYQIEAYLLKDQPYDCAGSFKCESLGISLFERLESSDPTALVGLPLIALSQLLTEAGVDPLLEGFNPLI